MAEDLHAWARRWFEQVWNQQRAEAIDDMMDPRCVGHGLGEGGADVVGTEGFKQFHDAYTKAFPDLRIQVEEVVVEGDRVATRFTGTGTHRGHDLGIPATDRPVSFTGMSLVYVRDGKMVEAWNNVDLAGVMQQITA